jgi:hypothetical protein
MNRSIRHILLIYLITHAPALFAQYYPQNYFGAPLDTPLYLSATFGSLRDNHFHSGMDIRTYEKEGYPVYAVADGFVSRIKVSPVGYGKAVYIDHPNGYTSVYGHLQRYEGAVADYTKKYQYQRESFDIDYFPGRDKIPVKKGQIIGWSGNSGGSTGPHLHFEIRNTQSEEPLNPQLFGITGVDYLDPAIKKILLYNLDGNRPLLLKKFSVVPKKTIGTDTALLYDDTIEVPKGLIGIGAEAYDYLTDPEHEYTLYGMEMYIDDKEFFSYRIDRINFENTRCVNVHIDYELYKREQVRFQKCFVDDGNLMKIYNFIRNRGKYNLKDDAVHKVSVRVYDFAGHFSLFSFFIKGTSPEPAKENKKLPCRSAFLYPGKDNVFKAANVILEVPARALYDTLEFCYEVLKEKDRNAFSATYKIHDEYTPLHKSFVLSIRPENVPEALQDKLLLAYANKENGHIRSAGGEYKNGYVMTRSTMFGNYFVTIDSVAPVIKPLNISKEGTVKDTTGIKFRIEDNFSGIASYRGTINNKWVLMDYDPKNDLLVYEFDEKTLFNEKLNMELTVVDRKGNTSSFQKEIIFKRQTEK